MPAHLTNARLLAEEYRTRGVAYCREDNARMRAEIERRGLTPIPQAE